MQHLLRSHDCRRRALHLGLLVVLLPLLLRIAAAPHAAAAAALTVGTTGPYAAAVGHPVSLVGSASGAVCLNPSYTFVWEFGDGQLGISQATSHVYLRAQTYLVQLTVVDACVPADHGTATTTVVVVQADGTGGCPTPQGAILSVAATPPNPGVGQGLTLSAAVSGGGSAAYLWDFGDGQTAATLVPTSTHTYATGGTYTATVTVAGTGLSGCAATTVPVGGSSNGASGVQVAANGPYTGTAGQPVTFTGQAVSANAGAGITSYSWTFGDGTSVTGSQPAHTYSAPGTYAVALTVTDATGASTTATTTVTIVGAGRVVPLLPGCNNLVATWADATSPATIGDAVSPPAMLVAVWKLVDPASAIYAGYFPSALAATDLQGVDRLDAIFVCVSGPATVTEPSV